VCIRELFCAFTQLHALQFLHCTARFKVYLDETPIDFGLNFTDMVFGNGDNSLCGGGDGPMKVCELQP
jgi:hypothetical protein